MTELEFVREVAAYFNAVLARLGRAPMETILKEAGASRTYPEEHVRVVINEVTISGQMEKNCFESLGFKVMEGAVGQRKFLAMTCASMAGLMARQVEVIAEAARLAKAGLDTINALEQKAADLMIKYQSVGDIALTKGKDPFAHLPALTLSAQKREACKEIQEQAEALGMNLVSQSTASKGHNFYLDPADAKVETLLKVLGLAKPVVLLPATSERNPANGGAGYGDGGPSFGYTRGW